MKKITLLLCLSFINAHPSFHFQTHKTDRNYITGVLRTDFLTQLKQTFNSSIFIETGTHHGGTAINAGKVFETVYTSELFPAIYEQTKNNLRQHTNIHIYNLHSAVFIEEISQHISSRPIFWLDAHYSGPGTAFSSSDHTKPSAMTPIKDELEAIKKYNPDTIILIDDARLFASHETSGTFPGHIGYPSVQEICTDLRDINNNFAIALIGDTLIAYDKNINVALSPVTKACTISRLYDGTNYTDEQLIRAEEIIKNSQSSEAQLIKVLNTVVLNDKSMQVYHYALWRGLNCLNDNPTEAYNLFSTIVNKYHYSHWRIKWYLAQTCIKLNRKEDAINYLKEIIQKTDYTPVTNLYHNLAV